MQTPFLIEPATRRANLIDHDLWRPGHAHVLQNAAHRPIDERQIRRIQRLIAPADGPRPGDEFARPGHPRRMDGLGACAGAWRQTQDLA